MKLTRANTKRFFVAMIVAAGMLGVAAGFPSWLPKQTSVKAAADNAAVPAPTPLSREAAAALVERLKESLADAVESEEDIDAIAAKWDRRQLAGRTRQQILDLLYADLKTVITDAEVQDTIWESWQGIGSDETDSGPTEPETPAVTLPEYQAPVLRGGLTPRSNSPEAGLANDVKRLEGLKEELTFQGFVNQIPRWSQPQTLNYKRQSYTVYRDLDDPEGQVKFDGVQKGIAMLVDNNVVLPFGLTFYLARDIGALGPTAPYCKNPDGSMASVQLPNGKTWPKCMAMPAAQAFKRSENWRPVARVVISSLRNIDGSMSGRGLMNLPKTPVTTIHEVSHILHERSGGEFFWTIPAGHGSATAVGNAMTVGAYATKGPKEFVAEVFTGNMLGLKFSAEILADYQKWRGPRLAK